MNGLSTDHQGRHKIQCRLPDGTRSGFRLGRMPKRQAEEIARHVMEILSARRAGGRLPDASATWLGRIPRPLVKTLLRTRVIDDGMVAPEETVITLGGFLDQFMAKQSNKKPSTQKQLALTRKYLLMCFDADRELGSITAGDADDFRVWLIAPTTGKKALAENTVRRQCGRAKQLFRNALRHRLIASNPFADMRHLSVFHNPDRDAAIPPSLCQDVLAACPNWEWRVIFALSRFGGLRLPSEIASLRWRDVYWEEGRIRLVVPKLEHLPGRGTRDIPIFSELYPHLRAAKEASDRDEEFVVPTPHYRHSESNLRTHFLRILNSAGIAPWPSLFQNLRANRFTELVAQGYEEWKVNQWLGNTRAVGREHYLQMRDDDYLAASGMATIDRPTARLRSGSAGHRMGSQGAATSKNGEHPNRHVAAKTPIYRAEAREVNKDTVPRLGLEPRTL
jgi:integrase